MSDERFFEELRFKLLRKYPFFGSLIHRVPLKRVALGAKEPVAKTNGKEIVFNSDKYNDLLIDEQLFIFGHEIFHVGFMHPIRMHGIAKTPQDKLIANLAGDFLINALLKDMGMTVPAGAAIHDALTPDKYSILELYALLKKLLPPDQGGKGEKPNKNDPKLAPATGKGFSPDVEDPHGMGEEEGGGNGEGEEEEISASKLDEAEQEMQGIMEQAANLAKMAGRGSPMLDRMIEKWKSTKIPWEVLLQDWMEKKTKEIISWSKPHRRTHTLGIYLPSRGGYKMGHMGVAIDLSGSIGAREIGIFTSQLQYLFERCRPEKITVITFDDGVRDVMEFEEMPSSKELRLRGGGGTDFRPVFQKFTDIYNNDPENFEGIIFMTDMMGPFPTKEPPFPTVFLNTYGQSKGPGWGTVIDASDVLKEEN